MDWISVEDRRPEDGQVVLCYGRDPHINGNPWRRYVVRYKADVPPFGEEWDNSDRGAIQSVSHWMPLPEPPETP